MAAGIDLPTVAEFTDVPHATLRYWARIHRWQVVGVGARGAKLYDVICVMALCKKHPAFQRQLIAERERLAA